MKILGIITIIFISICAFVLLILHIKSKRLFRSLFLNAFLGLTAIALVNLVKGFTGVHIPINWYTLGGGAVFGIPAVCGIVIMQMLI